MPIRFVMLPPQAAKTLEWAKRLTAALPDVRMVVAETPEQANEAITDADAAFGTLPLELLRKAQRLRWLQAPHAAPPAGYYYSGLACHRSRKIFLFFP